MAKIQPRTNQIDARSKLEDLVPLPEPFVLMIDPSSSCNLRCLFCPTGNTDLISSTGRFQGFMELKLFEKIISDLKDFNGQIKTLRLYKEGEPLVNPFFHKFVELAKKSNKFKKIDTTTNGILLTRELSRKIIDSGIDQINISINGLSAEQYYSLTKVHLNFDRMVDEISYLHSISGNCEIYVKSIAENLSDDDRDKFYKIFSPISDRIFMENLQPNWPNFTFDYVKPDYKVGHYGQPLIDRKVCPYIFYIMVVNSDGTVSACVQDWEHKLILGDVRTDSLRNIWSGPKLRQLQVMHLIGERFLNSTCAICPVLKHGALDNLDSKAQSILLNKYKSNEDISYWRDR